MIYIVGWIVCGVLTYGITFAYFQKKYPIIARESYREDMGIAVFYGLLGPIGLFVILVSSGFAKYGLKFY